jgi:hypothetical protein
MTMMRQLATAAAAGLTALLLGGQQAQAQDDTVRLGGNIDSKITTLSYDGDSEITLMRGVRGFVGYRGGYGHYGHGHVGFRVGYGGGYGYGIGRGYYGGGYYGGYNRAYYGGGYYGGGYYGGYSPYYYSSYSSPYYYNSYPYCAPTVYYTQPSYSYYPIGDVQVGPTVAATRPSANVAPAQQVLPAQHYQLPQPQQYQPGTVPMPSADGTYPYDGGPVNPIPLPKKTGIDTTDGRIVGLPAQQKLTTQVGGSGFAYPAYGDSTATTTFAAGRPSTIVIGSPTKK